MSESRIKTGIAGLDERLGGGLPSGSLVLLLSKSETSLRMFGQQVSYSMAEGGNRVFYLTILKEPHYVREEMDLYEWKTAGFEEKGRWFFVDGCTPKISALMGQHRTGPRFDLFVLIRASIFSKMEKQEVIVIDSLSDLLVTQESQTVIELLEIASSHIRKNGGLLFIPIIMDMHEPRLIATISHLADVVIELEIDETRFNGIMRFWKMRRARSEPLGLQFSITDRGIMTETFSRVV